MARTKYVYIYSYTVYTRYFWQGNHQIYGHKRYVYTVLANPTCLSCFKQHRGNHQIYGHLRYIYTVLANPTLFVLFQTTLWKSVLQGACVVVTRALSAQGFDYLSCIIHIFYLFVIDCWVPCNWCTNLLRSIVAQCCRGGGLSKCSFSTHKGELLLTHHSSNWTHSSFDWRWH
jgi:hypothetical protein